MRAREFMTRSVVTVRPERPIAAAGDLLLSRGVRTLPVVDADDRLVGIVSGADLLRDRVGPDPRAHARPVPALESDPPRTVGDVMTRAVVALPETADQAAFADAMLRHRIRSIPVVSHDRLVGLVTSSDLLRTQLRSDAEVERDVRRLLDEHAVGTAAWAVRVRNGIVTLSGVGTALEREIAVVLAQEVRGTVGVYVEQDAGQDEPAPEPAREAPTPVSDGAHDRRGLQVLTLDECLDRLRQAPIGRLAFLRDGSPAVLPVNHGVDGVDVVFRTTWGSKLLLAQQQGLVAFEVDGADEHRETGWSVLVSGRASVVTEPEAVDRLDRLGLRSWAGTDKDTLWVRVRPDDVSGREIVAPWRAPGRTSPPPTHFGSHPPT